MIMMMTIVVVVVVVVVVVIFVLFPRLNNNATGTVNASGPLCLGGVWLGAQTAVFLPLSPGTGEDTVSIRYHIWVRIRHDPT